MENTIDKRNRCLGQRLQTRSMEKAGEDDKKIHRSEVRDNSPTFHEKKGLMRGEVSSVICSATSCSYNFLNDLPSEVQNLFTAHPFDFCI